MKTNICDTLTLESAIQELYKVYTFMINKGAKALSIKCGCEPEKLHGEPIKVSSAELIDCHKTLQSLLTILKNKADKTEHMTHGSEDDDTQ